jgi:hypothetical protein
LNWALASASSLLSHQRLPHGGSAPCARKLNDVDRQRNREEVLQPLEQLSGKNFA